MTIQDVAAIRLQQQGILRPRTSSPLEVVLAMGAMQAQDYSSALWAIGLRTGLTEQQVVQTIEGQSIIRTWPQRGTLHFVPAADAAWLVGLSAARMLKGAALRRQRLGLTDDILSHSQATVMRLLKIRALVSRSQLLAELQRTGIETAGGSGYHILWYLAQNGITYVGPMEGKQQTFGLLSTLAARNAQPDRARAIAETTKRYFVSHGPATAQDFMWWSGLLATEVKAGLAANSATLRSEVIDGKTYWFSKDAQPADITQTAFLLPGFDEYILGYKDRSAVLKPAYSNRIVPGGNGMFLPTIVLGGQVVGTWKRTRKSKSVQVHMTLFEPLKAANKKLLAEAAQKYASFVQLPLELDIA